MSGPESTPLLGITEEQAFEVLKALFSLHPVEGSDFHFNEANDYGSIKLTIFTTGDATRFVGTPEVRRYIDRKKGGFVSRNSGFYFLNDQFIQEILPKVMEKLSKKNSV